MMEPNIPKINPSKINGSCGRLLCCLTYEDEEYSRCHVGMPSVGQKMNTSFGEGVVSSVDILNRKYKVFVNGEYEEFKLDEESTK